MNLKLSEKITQTIPNKKNDGLLGDDAKRVDADARDEQDGEPREAAEIIGAVGRHAAFLFRCV